ncbi:hypothetical protein GGR58DRAFT_524193 [Xylaria digitata]|nr:hypothetical protein GGR58DRAFT_524193 [Xylaria digitata]
MSYPQTRSQTRVATQASIPEPQPGALSTTPINTPVQKGMPFKRMHMLREEVGTAMTKLAQAKTLVANAQKTPGHSLETIEWLQSDVRFKSAELVSLRKKLAPLEANFQKAQAQGKARQKDTSRNNITPEEPHPPTKKRKKTDGSQKTSPLEQVSVALEPMMNTATLEGVLPPGGCTLTADECQYDHIERLRRQYARPFELFCEEMDAISDSCLTGICLAMPKMPWSIAVSRLAFLTKSTLDSHGSHTTPSDVRCLSTGTTVGCQYHIRYIKLAELMVIQDWRDFMRWAHHQSHVFNLCGQRSCIKLKHMCLEPIDCLSSRTKCRVKSDELINSDHSQSTSQALSSTAIECSSPGCWPPCLPSHRASNILHSVAVEYAAFNNVSFGSLTSTVKKELYTPINEHQLGRLVSNENIGLAFPFRISYGHIFVNKRESDLIVEVDTLLPIPAMYTSEDMQRILQGLPSWKEISLNSLMDSIFWYGRRRTSPSISMYGNNPNLSAHFACGSPRYECPFCNGFDNYFNPQDSSVEMLTDFDNFIGALRHILLTHTRVPILRKLRFLYEETQECPTIRDAWKLITREKYDDSIASLAKGEIPQAIADICRYANLAGRMPTEVSKDMAVEPVAGKGIESEPKFTNTLCYR